MTTQLNTKINKAEKSNPVSPKNGNKRYVLGEYDIDPRNRILILSHVKIGEVPQGVLDIVGKISPIARDELTLGKAIENYGEKVEDQKAKLTINTKKTEPFLGNKDLEGMVESYCNNFYKKNVLFTNNGATLAGQDDLMAHCTIAGANSLNNLGEKVKSLYNKASEKITDKISNLSPRTKRIVYVGLVSLFGLSATVGLPGCNGTVTPPVNDIDKYDTLDQPFPHQKQEESIWCFHASGSATLDYNGFDYSQEFLDTKITNENGYGLGTKLVEFVNNEVPGFKAKYVFISLDKIKELINIYDLPIIVNQKAGPSADPKKPGHVTVVIGYGLDYVTVSNPSDGKEHTLDGDYFLSLNVFWDNTDPNKNLSIVIYPKDLNLNLPPSAYKSEVEGKDYIQQTFEPIIGYNTK